MRPIGLAVLVIGAVTSASASATPLCKPFGGGSKFALCFNEPLELVEGTFRLHINNDPTTPTKAFIFKGSEVELNCPEVLLQLGATMRAGRGISLGIRAAGIVLHFIHCTTPKPPFCEVTNQLIVTKTLDAVPTPRAEDRKVLFLPETGTLFALVELKSTSEGTCLIAGKENVTALHNNDGEGPLCNAPDGETTTILQLTECVGTTKNTNLKFGGKEIEVKGNFSSLLEGQKTKWAVILGE